MATASPFACFNRTGGIVLLAAHVGFVGACSPKTVADTTPAQEHAPRAPDETSLDVRPKQDTPSGGDTDTNAEVPTFDGKSEYVLVDIGELPSPVLWRHTGPQTRPLIVSAHGAGGTPEWHCQWLSAFVQESAFVLCLRGKRMGRDVEAYYYPEHHTLGALFKAATQHVYRDYTKQLDLERQVYVAYSQGATMGALMMLDQEEPLPNLLLIEGGYEYWTTQRCKRYAESGGRKVFFACGTQTCNQKALAAVERLRSAGVQAEAAYAPGAGHTPAGDVGALAREGLLWLLEAGDDDGAQQP